MYFLLFILVFKFTFFFCSESDASGMFFQETLQQPTVSNLIIAGVKHIASNGFNIDTKAGPCKQAFDVNYVLNPLETMIEHEQGNYRVPFIRGPKGVRYFARELLAYFNGDLTVDKLAKASPFWQKLADKNGCINSNYGYYVFHQRLPNDNQKTQLDWVLECLLQNPDSRRAFITINQLKHKDFESKDFPCTIGMQFYVRGNYFICSVSSRSTDIFTGLPYDMGFFSFVHELVYRLLLQKGDPDIWSKIKLGYVVMKTNFTQIYEKTNQAALELIATNPTSEEYDPMPLITDAQATLSDIYNQTYITEVMKWILKYAEANN